MEASGQCTVYTILWTYYTFIYLGSWIYAIISAPGWILDGRFLFKWLSPDVMNIPAKLAYLGIRN